jgi:5-methylcytosine-specific restriction endonuclease McrA
MGARIFIPINTTYNRLTVIENIMLGDKSACICKCSCGTITKPILTSSLKNNSTKSCGCLAIEVHRLAGLAKKNKPSPTKGKKFCSPLTGRVFGRLSVIEKTNQVEGIWREKYKCICSCGEIVVVDRSHLLSGDTKSCGCLSRELVKQRIRQYRIQKNADPDISLETKNRFNRHKVGKIRNKVLIRDNKKCQLCDNKINLQVHHIVPFSQDEMLISNEDNLITLCKNCHDLAHDFNSKNINLKIQQKLFSIIKKEPFNVL